MSDYNRGVDLRGMAAGLTGLDRAIVEVLSGHVGREKAMPRGQLVRRVRMYSNFKTVNERQIRMAIQELRNAGKALICSTGGVKGGYWIAAGWDDVEEFIENELEPRALGLLQTKKAMLSAAGQKFGPRPVARQDSLF